MNCEQEQELGSKCIFSRTKPSKYASDTLYIYIKTPNSASKDDDLKVFEKRMFVIPNRIKSRDPRNAYQNKLKKDVSKIKGQERLVVMSDKTRNAYLCKSEDYNKYMSNAITKDYKKADINVISIINSEAAAITNKLEISDRVDQFRLQEPFITIKDHKADFPARIDTRLINPAKSNIGVISKQILDRVNEAIRSKLGVKQWKSTAEVLDWFHQILNKDKSTFTRPSLKNCLKSC